MPAHAVVLLPPDRKFLIPFLKAHEYLDVIIPRGGAGLITMVRENASVPVIETGASVVHTFVDTSANIAMACNIIWNEKTRRPSVCNAVDTILVHQAIAKQFLPELAKTMLPSRTILHVDQKSYAILKAYYKPELLKQDAAKQFSTEFLSLQMNVVIVPSLDAALKHIAQYSLKHSESIVTENAENAARFEREVDAACVYVNTSTSFSDGAQFGMGAEIGISTQKLHARGPMALRELTSYKWIVNSQGKIRNL
jgi:glutamate-5-semialdehyde dehydrogenase